MVSETVYGGHRAVLLSVEHKRIKDPADMTHARRSRCPVEYARGIEVQTFEHFARHMPFEFRSGYIGTSPHDSQG